MSVEEGALSSDSARSLAAMVEAAAMDALLPSQIGPKLDPMHAEDPRLAAAPPLLAARSPPETANAQLAAESEIYMRADAEELLLHAAVGLPLASIAAHITPATRDLVVRDMKGHMNLRAVGARPATETEAAAAGRARRSGSSQGEGGDGAPAAPSAPSAPSLEAIGAAIDRERARAAEAAYMFDGVLLAGLLAAMVALALLFFYLLRRPARPTLLLALVALASLLLPGGVLALRMPLAKLVLDPDEQVARAEAAAEAAAAAAADPASASAPALPSPRIYPLLKRSAAEQPFAVPAEREAAAQAAAAEAEGREPAAEAPVVAAVMGQAASLEEAVAQARRHNALAHAANVSGEVPATASPGRGVSPLSDAGQVRAGVLYPILRAVHWTPQSWTGYAAVPLAQAVAAGIAEGAGPALTDEVGADSRGEVDFERQWSDSLARALSYHATARKAAADALREGLDLLQGLRGAYAGARSAANPAEVALALAARNVVVSERMGAPAAALALEAYDAYFSPDPALFAAPAASPAELLRLLAPAGLVSPVPLAPAFPPPGTAAEVSAQMRTTLGVPPGAPLTLVVQLAALSQAAERDPAVAPALAAPAAEEDAAAAEPGQAHPTSWQSRARTWMARLMLTAADFEGNDPTDLASLREAAAVLPEEAPALPITSSTLVFDTPAGAFDFSFWPGVGIIYGTLPLAYAVALAAHLVLVSRGAKIAPAAAAPQPKAADAGAGAAGEAGAAGAAGEAGAAGAASPAR